MKCPQCGRWNRASLNKCFFCGNPLPLQSAADMGLFKSANSSYPKPSSTKIYTVDADGNATESPDAKDALAADMSSLHTRRIRGEQRQARIRSEIAAEGYVPTDANIYTNERAAGIHAELGAENKYDNHNDFRPDAMPPVSESAYHYDDYSHTPDYQPLWETGRHSSRSRGMSPRRMRHVRFFGLRRVLPVFSILLLIGIIGASGYFFLLKPYLENSKVTLQDQVVISSSIIDDMAAHTILIPADEGSQIYIKELRKSYIVTAGYATVEVPDYKWYELSGTLTEPTMDVTLTPYIKTSAGEQKLMEPITYTIDIPLSPVTLVTPDTTYLEVTTSPYTIKFKVEQNSTVTINGEDYSSFVNTQDGYISYLATVTASGNNVFDIVVNCQYYRENHITITLYRAPQDVPLELRSTLGSTSANQLMNISGTTVPGATITVLSDYEDLNTTDLAKSGAFSFNAKFTKIGTNVITIVASKDGYSSTLTKEVYYVPYASTYTPKAWPMDATNYSEYLNNTAIRVANTQIYLCTGTITEILSNKPQLALMDTDDSETSERLVLIENMSSDTWVVGERYRVYADAYGVYDGKPRLVGRYTYAPLE